MYRKFFHITHIQKLEISYWQSDFFHHRRRKEEKSGKRSRAIQKEVYWGKIIQGGQISLRLVYKIQEKDTENAQNDKE